MGTVEKTVHLNLVGLNGNAFALIGAFMKQARKERWTKQEIDAVIKEATASNYSHLLATLSEHCNSEPEENEEDNRLCSNCACHLNDDETGIFCEQCGG